MTENLIDKYHAIVSKYCDSPKEFITGSAYHIISALPGRFFSSRCIPGQPKTGMKPNVWFIMSSIPGRTRRSALSKYDTYVYRGVSRNFLSDEKSIT